MSKPVTAAYRTTNWRAYNAALKQRGSLLIWFDPEMEWRAPASGRRGRPAAFSDAAIQTCLMLKALFGLPLRQTTGLVESLLKLAKLDWPVPDFSTLCRRQKDLTVTMPYRSSQGALQRLIDSTGIAMGEGEWSCRKHGASQPRQWCKLHLGIDAKTLEVRAVEVSGSRVGDGPMLPKLLEQIPPEEQIGTVTADGAYDTRACHAAIAARQVTAVIPTRRNGRPWKETTPGAQARNEILRASRRVGRAIWRNWSGYHRRSLIEAKMRCMRLLGERLMARSSDRQTAVLRSAPPFSTASPPSARPRRCVFHKANRGQGQLAPRANCSTEPVNPRKLRDILVERGIARSSEDGEINAWEVLDAEAAKTVLDAIGSSINGEVVRSNLGISRSQFELQADGFLAPQNSGGSGATPRRTGTFQSSWIGRRSRRTSLETPRRG